MIKIGTNIKYQGDQYLDFRQGLPKTYSDLLNWSIPVPEGFEVYLNTVTNGEEPGWYYYCEEYDSELTGHFRKREDNSDWSQEISDLWNAIDSLRPALTFEAHINGSGNKEIEQEETVYPTLTWHYTSNNSTSTIDPTLITQQLKKGSTILDIDSPNYSSSTRSYVDGDGISENTTYTITLTYTNGSTTLTSNKGVVYRFGTTRYKYWGVSSSDSITTYTDLDAGYSSVGSWTLGWTLPETSFNCSGGKYVYYIFPNDLYDPETFGMWVGGIRMSAFSVTQSTIDGEEYAIVKTDNIQTGSQILVEFKS